MKKKPKFKRQQLILKKLKDRWRKPKGLHSKLRLKKKGKGKRPKIGYGSDKKIRYSTEDKRLTYIENIKKMEDIKKPIIISSNLGLRKKLEIIKKAKEKDIKILNIKDIDKFLEKIKKKQEEKAKNLETKKEKKSKNIEKEKKELSKEEKEKKLKEEKKKVLEKGL